MKSLLSGLIVVAQYAASASVSAVIGNVIAVKLPANAKPLTKASIAFGTLIVCGIASDMAMKYVETQITEVADAIVQTKDAVVQQVNASIEASKAGEG
jgi:hypothetical protein